MILRLAIALGLSLAAPQPSRACDLALSLAVDVSGSVDATEFRIQMGGLAGALRDGLVSEALVRAKARVSLVQWSGANRQAIVVPWIEMTDFDAVERLAVLIETAPRVWSMYSTAIGEALNFAAQSFAEAGDCTRRVIDISGDGVSNEGVDPASQLNDLMRAEITVNALVIETGQDDLTGYFWENVITGPDAFVVSARGFEDYPARIRRKLIRETTMQMSGQVTKGRGVAGK